MKSKIAVYGAEMADRLVPDGRANHGWTSTLLWVLAAASVMSHMAIILLHLPQAVGGAMLASFLTLFGLLHGASTYGWRGILFFLVVCLGVSNAFENLSILTGFPFGWYHYSDAMGSRLFLVPLQIGPAYFGVGYLSWTLARAILGDEDTRLAGLLSFATPAIASFIMVSWDLSRKRSRSSPRRLYRANQPSSVLARQPAHAHFLIFHAQRGSASRRRARSGSSAPILPLWLLTHRPSL
jgi:hypothetical protein